MPLQSTSGTASYDAFGGGAAVEPVYIEQIFSTYLYTGTGSTQTITNGIDLSGKGGLVWMKTRSAAYSHFLADTARGVDEWLRSNTTNPSMNANDSIPAFNSNGFTVGTYPNTNDTGVTFASWTFRKQPKFFDVVTLSYTSGAAVFNHSLGSVPGFVIIKVSTGYSDNWWVYHRSLGNDQYISLNLTSQAQTSTGIFSATDTTFTVKNGIFGASTIVAYLYAHDAGGFGLTGTDNVISCGSATVNGSGAISVTLGYEPQWVLLKNATTAGNWILQDTMRGYTVQTNNQTLKPNLSDAETSNGYSQPNATGFSTPNGTLGSGDTYIYIAIRRGPMKVPTSGTSVFAPVLNTGTGANTNISSGGFAPDTLWNKTRDHSYGLEAWDKLRGVTQIFEMTSPSAEVSGPTGYDLVSFNNTGVTEGVNSSSTMNISGWTYVNYLFGRAPNFYDTVCYTGTGVARTVTHNLGVAPEMMIVKMRTNDPTFGGMNWTIYHSALGNTKGLYFTNTAALGPNIGFWNNTTPTSSVFSLGTDFSVNDSNGGPQPFVAYLFATCAGVSKVGSYTGNGSTQTIDCGFTGGARFVLIKRTDSTGDWYTYDTARGMTTLTDPYLLLNSTAAESATLGSVTTVSTGFALNAGILAAINTNGASYIFLAVS